MAWTESEVKRIEAIERRINEIQVALNNMASRKQMKSILNVRQAEIDDLKARVTALEAQVLALQSE